jgi:N-acetylmuramoyl-L-alanine amidase
MTRLLLVALLALQTGGVAQPVRRRIIVDAGHGGPDAGMHGPIGGRFTIYEKDVTLAVSRKLAAALRDRGHDVVMTRTTDTLIALGDRGRIANEKRGDLFISIHVNAANPGWNQPGTARGFETYFLAEAKTEDERRVANMENASEKYDPNDGPGNDPLSFLLADMRQNEHLRESSQLAQVIQSRLRGVHPGPSRGVKQAGFRVLVTAFMPSVLVEIGFGTNPAEAAWISSPEGQQQIADAVADAAVDYLSQYEKRVSPGNGPQDRRR